jgi:SAM-dependent methyltransferase
MDREAYTQYQAEAANWLKRGRMRLLDATLGDIGDHRQPLRLLEIGAGVGQNVPVLARFGEVDVVEIDPQGLDGLRRVAGIGRIYDQPIPFELDAHYDVIVAFDVLEHLSDDHLAAAWIFAHLKPGGHLIATVPAYQWLFAAHDVALHHYRRYTRSSLIATLPAGATVLRAGYFNCLLFPLAAASRVVMAAWQRLGGSATAPARKQSSQVPGVVDRLFAALLTAEVSAIGHGMVPPFGLSVFCLARKEASP